LTPKKSLLVFDARKGSNFATSTYLRHNTFFESIVKQTHY